MANSIFQTSPADAVTRSVHWLRAGRAVLWLGGSGIGKSTMVHHDLAIALSKFHKGFNEKNPLKVEADIRCAYRDAVDMRGIPVADREAGVTRWLQPAELPTEGPCIIFIDEIGQGSVPVQNACMQLVLDRRLGNYVVPENVYIIAASNREEDGSYIRKMSAALRQRFAVIEITPNAHQFRLWGVANGLDRRILAATVMFSELVEGWQGEDVEGQQSTARELTALDAILKDKSVEQTRANMLGFACDVLGEAHGLKVAPFISDYDGHVKVRDIIKDPEGCRLPEVDKFDNAISLTIALARFATKDTVESVLKYIDRMEDKYRTLFATSFDELNEAAKNNAYMQPIANDWKKKNDDLTG